MVGSQTCDSWTLTFEGTDLGDVRDWFTDANLQPGGPNNKYHMGFFEYQNSIKDCINERRSTIKSQLNQGRDIDFIMGHSLGGAAATIYAQEHGNGVGVVTWGAPKTNYRSSGSVKGWRFWHELDPITGDVCELSAVVCPMSRLQHVVRRHGMVWWEENVNTEWIEKKVPKDATKCPVCFLGVIMETILEEVTVYSVENKLDTSPPVTERNGNWPNTDWLSALINLASFWARLQMVHFDYVDYPGVFIW